MVRLEFVRDAAGFLDEAGEYLSADPVVSTVVASVAARFRARGGSSPPQDWWLLVRDGRRVVGAGMRTAPWEPRPLYLLPMPDEAAVGLARALHERGEETTAVNGALPAARLCADEVARLTGRRAEVQLHMRLHRAAHVVPPRTPGGHLRRAGVDEVDLVRQWFEAFFVDADEQAGRPCGAHAGEVPTPEETRWRVETGEVWLWEAPDGDPVHMTCVNPPAFGVARIGPVYTPPDLRGHGYAGATVAAVTQRVLDDGMLPCLFTDQANPVSNKLYAAIGYQPVVDSANLVLVD